MGVVSAECLALGAEAALSGVASVVDHAHGLVALVARDLNLIVVGDVLLS